ncbi:MAG: hypothetical protein D6725_15070 [Planctomycetota bacterium]|nr:MAG: hypothetical protein D6725_15070 [Planctomycetota bacterium]
MRLDRAETEKLREQALTQPISEVVVVGGGPAGSACAAELVRLGIPVLVWDRAVFPRDKVCAGWITPQIADALRLDPAEYGRRHVCQPILAFRVGLIGADTIEVQYDRPVSYGIRRCEFDTYLLRRCGAALQLGEPVRRIQRCSEGWTINGRLRTRMLVGAGGHFCPVARTLRGGRDSAAPTVPAQEIEFRMTSEQARHCRVAPECPELYFCRDFLGYAWCFRKGDYLNIGIGRIGEPRLSAHLQDFLAFLKRTGRVPFDLPGRFKGHAYRLLAPPLDHAVADAAVLVGDALGLAYPQSGEGIRPAVESGLLAARTIAAAAGRYDRTVLQRYADWLHDRFVGDRAIDDAAMGGLDATASSHTDATGLATDGRFSTTSAATAAGTTAPSESPSADERPTTPHTKRLTTPRLPARERRRDIPAAGDGPLRRLRCLAGRLLLRNPWFVRRIVLEKWFLHRHVPPVFGTREASSTDRRS